MVKDYSSKDNSSDDLLHQLQEASEEQRRIADRQEAILVRLRQELSRVTRT